MGLDTYINKRIYIGANYRCNDITGDINIVKNGINMNIPLDEVAYISVRAGDWRKCWWLHSWFVDNIDNYNDFEYNIVPLKVLDLLKENLERILSSDRNNMKDISQAIFGDYVEDFFYDEEDVESFKEELKRTLEIVNDILSTPGIESFEYCASW